MKRTRSFLFGKEMKVNMEEKERLLETLAIKRKNNYKLAEVNEIFKRWAQKKGIKPEECSNIPYEFDAGNHVSPYSRTMHNYNADIMVILQDWSSTESLAKLTPDEKDLIAEKGYSPYLPTNKNLFDLLKRTFNLNPQDIYATNLFVFIKPGKLGAEIPQKCFDICAEAYAIPQIEIIQPKIVICSGRVYQTIKKIIQKKKELRNNKQSTLDSVNNPETWNNEKTRIFGIYHTGSNRRLNWTAAEETAHWQKIRQTGLQ